MTGPPYPPAPAVGSNAIGSFAIGVSPIGTIAAFDVWTTVISQYANSPILTGIITDFSAALDQTENFDNFYDMIWNVLTAVGPGLDLLGRIVGVARTLNVGAGGDYFGFQDPSGAWTGFNQGVFYSGASLSNNVVLSDAQFRPLVLAKAAANICDGSIPAINSILLALFAGRGAAYVADGLNMSMTYTFSFALTPLDAAIVAASGILPQPAGVVIQTSAPP